MFVDNGLLRLGEAEQVINTFQESDNQADESSHATDSNVNNSPKSLITTLWFIGKPICAFSGTVSKDIFGFFKSVLQADKNIEKIYFIHKAYEFIEKNPYLLKFANYTLYDHQKELFWLCKNTSPKLVNYIAPTGTGKTLSPIGLTKGNKVIFTCAAKHVGMQLAKCCISLHIPIAIAFGCSDPGDIRFHYFAAKDFVRHRKTGQIFRVDNSVGDKVEIIIYEPSLKGKVNGVRVESDFNKFKLKSRNHFVWFKKY